MFSSICIGCSFSAKFLNLEVILKSLKVVVLSVPVPLVISFYLHTSFIVTGVVCVVSVSVISYVFGLDENERTFVGKRLKGALLKMGC